MVSQVDVPEKKLLLCEVRWVRVILVIIEKHLNDNIDYVYEIIVSCWELLKYALGEVYHNSKLFIEQLEGIVPMRLFQS